METKRRQEIVRIEKLKDVRKPTPYDRSKDCSQSFRLVALTNLHKMEKSKAELCFFCHELKFRLVSAILAVFSNKHSSYCAKSTVFGHNSTKCASVKQVI